MRRITNFFPGLLNTSFKVTSPETTQYNCIAWAAEDTESWWWPDMNFQYYWPPNVPRHENLNAFISAFETLGYIICKDGDYEEGFIKIAIYVNKNGIPTHAARLLTNGKWTSKCGMLEDIEHEIDALCGQEYGSIAHFMKKQRN